MLRRTRALLGLPALLCLVLLGLPASARDKPAGPLLLAGGWQLALDPTDAGLSAGWQRPDVALPAPRPGRTGESLADQGVPNWKGYAWLRREVHVPDNWPRVLLGFGAVDVATQVYADGALVGAFDDATLGAKAALIDLTGRVRPGSDFTLAFRVRGEGGFGGIKQEVRLGDDPAQVMTGQQYGQWLHDQHPDWRLLPWMSGGRRAWTAVGLEGAPAKAIVASDGSISPSAGGFSLSFWLFDQNARRLVDVGPPRAALADGSSPLPVLTFESGPWRLREEVLPAGSVTSPGVEARLTLLAAPGPAQLYVAARPYTASGGMWPLHSAAVTVSTVRLNGQPALALRTSTDAQRALPAAADASTVATASALPSTSRSSSDIQGGVLSTGDASTVAAMGALPSTRTGSGDVQVLLRATIAVGAPLTLLAPSIVGQPIPTEVEPSAAATAWQARLHQVQLDLPDRRLQQAYYASLGYILQSESRGQIHPGPLLHDAFWVRDAATIGYALDRAGLADAVRGSAEATLRAIAPDGQVTAITNPDGTPRADVEWDAPGEAAFTLAEYARASGDQAFLERAYPKMLAALRHALQARDASGLLPANESAEDLGSAAAHHYWDDLWLATGLREAAGAAIRLGDTAAAVEMDADEQSLRASLLASIAATGSDVIPNGPEDLTSSAMARGATPALWPLPILGDEQPLLRRSFDTYWQRFMPDGAYRHLYGQWWPYGGLEVAHALLFLGERDKAWQTLTYTLDHQTFPGLYAWAEGVDPATGDFAEGDMPHAWASAELANLVRDSLLYEDGDRLVVGAGVPAAWAGQAFAIRNAPTRWGNADLSVAADGQVTLSGARPPGGVELRLPFPARLVSAP